MADLKPPWPLSISAGQTFQRHAERIYREGRWSIVDHDALATYSETLELYQTFKAAVQEHGVLVQGRSPAEKVKNPILPSLSQARASLIVLARAVPLITGQLNRSDLDKEINDILNRS